MTKAQPETPPLKGIPQPVTLFGAGRMGSAMAAGWVAAGLALTIVDPKPSAQIERWAGQGKAVVNPAEPGAAGTLVVAVKPQIFSKVSAQAASLAGPETLVLSVMAGIDLDGLSAVFASPRLIRAMPNTPGAVGRGVTLLSPSAGATRDDMAAAEALLAPLGSVEGPMDEPTLRAAMAVSGCGPAYAFLLAEAMEKAGMEVGLDAALARRLAVATVSGAGELMHQTGDAPEALREAVTSPNGTTQAALSVLMREGAVPSLMQEALRAAIERDEEIAAGG